MDKAKLNTIGIILFIVFIIIFGAGSGYVFFNNSTNLAISIRSNDEQLKRDVAVNEALTKILVSKNDTIKNLGNIIGHIKVQNSIEVTKKDLELKKLKHEKDSLVNLIHNYKWSDLEPVNTKQPK